MFIAFEGIDGAGKSAQAVLLANALAKEGYAVQLIDKETRPMKQLKRYLLASSNSFLEPLSSFFLSFREGLSSTSHILVCKDSRSKVKRGASRFRISRCLAIFLRRESFGPSSFLHVEHSDDVLEIRD